MIIDKVANLSRYDYVPHVAKVIEFLKNNDVKSIEKGVYDLGDECRAVVSEYNTKELGDNEVVFEYHREYIDLQMVVCGEELMYTQSIDDGEEKTPFIEKDDYGLYTASWYNTIGLNEENFIVLFPNDLHGVGYAAVESIGVKKIVFKLKI